MVGVPVGITISNPEQVSQKGQRLSQGTAPMPRNCSPSKEYAQPFTLYQILPDLITQVARAHHYPVYTLFL